MKYIFIALSIFFITQSYGQVKVPASFFYDVSSKSNKKFNVSIKIKLDRGGKWHIYSQKPGKGPVATKVVFDHNPLIKLIDNTIERGNKIQKFDEAFKTKLSYYEGDMTLDQLITKSADVKTQLKGYVYFMVCDDTRCLPPTKEFFSISIP